MKILFVLLLLLILQFNCKCQSISFSGETKNKQKVNLDSVKIIISSLNFDSTLKIDFKIDLSSITDVKEEKNKLNYLNKNSFFINEEGINYIIYNYNAERVTVLIYSYNSELLFSNEKKLNFGLSNLNIQFGYSPLGIYFVEILYGNKVETLKAIKLNETSRTSFELEISNNLPSIKNKEIAANNCIFIGFSNGLKPDTIFESIPINNKNYVFTFDNYSRWIVKKCNLSLSLPVIYSSEHSTNNGPDLVYRNKIDTTLFNFDKLLSSKLDAYVCWYGYLDTINKKDTIDITYCGYYGYGTEYHFRVIIDTNLNQSLSLNFNFKEEIPYIQDKYQAGTNKVMSFNLSEIPIQILKEDYILASGTFNISHINSLYYNIDINDPYINGNSHYGVGTDKIVKLFPENSNFKIKIELTK